ncbi:MAG TPA: adenylate/guanylate cyclase domain-containing protein [Bacteroidia bacterium]|nr:adenylate/guanylate cyclase domain-containing protein [Bacteroidia bacterium]
MSDQKYKVLYVDDEENNLISFRAAFRHNYNIFTASSAETGINILRKECVPIIITDQRMPEITGVQFLEKIIPEFPDSIRMILTGFSDIEVIIQAINTGRVFRYITKPWDENELKMTIDNAISLFQLYQHNKQLLADLDQRLKEREKTLELFKRYVPSSVIEKLLKDDDDSTIFDGELRDVSVLFCDIRDFTEISSDLNPRDVVKILNEFYTVMSHSINQYNGFVNQYVGDEILAVFGAPLSYPENHSNAVFCALDMIKRLSLINDKFSSLINRKIEVGIGINAGEVITGNMGSRDKISYSLIGDTVNTAKRIESLTKGHQNAILIKDSLYNKVGHLFITKSWDPILVKGKKDPLQVYEVLGRRLL